MSRIHNYLYKCDSSGTSHIILDKTIQIIQLNYIKWNIINQYNKTIDGNKFKTQHQKHLIVFFYYSS